LTIFKLYNVHVMH